MSILTHAGIAAGVGIGRSDDCATFDYTGWAKKSDTSTNYITLYERYHFFGPPGR